MRSRSLLATLAVLPLAGGLLAAGGPASSATSDPPPRVSVSGGLRAVVKAPVGGDWAVQFVDHDGTVLASVDHDAIALQTGSRRVPADRVRAVHGQLVELGTRKAELTA